MSQAEELAKTTLDHIFLGTLSHHLTILLLGIIECSIGIMLIFYEDLKYTLIAAMLHLSCTFIPLVMLPQLIFGLAGEYILMNIVIMVALLAIYPFKKKAPTLSMYQAEQMDVYKNM